MNISKIKTNGRKFKKSMFNNEHTWKSDDDNVDINEPNNLY